MEMHRVGVALQHGGALEHDVHHGAVPEPPHHRTPVRRLQPHLLGAERDQRRVGEVERARRMVGEHRRRALAAVVVVAAAVVVVRLEDRRRRRVVEGDVVHVRDHQVALRLVPSLARLAAVPADGAQPERDVEPLVGARRHTRALPPVAEARQVAVEVEGLDGVVLVRHLRCQSHDVVVTARVRGAAGVVLQGPPGGELRRLRVRRRRLDRLGGDVVPAGGRVGDDQGVHRLAGRDHDDVRGVGREVVGVGGDHRELVPGDLEEVLGEERGVDYSKQVCLAGLHVQHVAIFKHTCMQFGTFSVSNLFIHLFSV